MEENLRTMDWPQKHLHWKVLSSRHSTRRMAVLAARFAPDELLHGTRTGKPPPPIIYLPNRQKIQVTLYYFFKPSQKRPRQHVMGEHGFSKVHKS